MSKFAYWLAFISLLLFFSCEKQEVNDSVNIPEENGTINAITSYTGTEAHTNYCQYYICDLNQLDVIMTFTQQIHEANMQGNPQSPSILTSNIQPLYRIPCENFRLSFDIAPGTYIIMSERYIYYDYSNIQYKTDSLGYLTLGFQYKVIQVESNEIENVAFIFQDYKPQ